MTKSDVILISGATGFVASYIARTFALSGKSVHLLVRDSSNLWRLNDIIDKFVLHTVDLTNRNQVQEVVRKIRPTKIFHLATYGAYPQQKDTSLMINTNIHGTMNLVDACAEVGFDSFINVSSSSEYGVKNKHMSETDVLNPNNLYGMTKAFATQYCQNLARTKSLPIMTFRIFAAYGYFEEPKRLIPSVILAYLNKKAPKLSSPTSVRDFIFIEDIFDALRVASEKPLIGEVFNLGTGTQYSIADVASIVSDITEVGLNPEWGSVGIKQHEPQTWVADMSKTRSLLNWAPKNSLKEGLRKTIEWFRKNKDTYERI